MCLKKKKRRQRKTYSAVEMVFDFLEALDASIEGEVEVRKVGGELVHNFVFERRHTAVLCWIQSLLLSWKNERSRGSEGGDDQARKRKKNERDGPFGRG